MTLIIVHVYQTDRHRAAAPPSADCASLALLPMPHASHGIRSPSQHLSYIVLLFEYLHITLFSSHRRKRKSELGSEVASPGETGAVQAPEARVQLQVSGSRVIGIAFYILPGAPCQPPLFLAVEHLPRKRTDASKDQDYKSR